MKSAFLDNLLTVITVHVAAGSRKIRNVSPWHKPQFRRVRLTEKTKRAPYKDLGLVNSPLLGKLDHVRSSHQPHKKSILLYMLNFFLRNPMGC